MTRVPVRQIGVTIRSGWALKCGYPLKCGEPFRLLSRPKRGRR